MAESKLSKQRNMFELVTAQTQGKRFTEAATGNFAMSVGEEAVDEALDNQK